MSKVETRILGLGEWTLRTVFFILSFAILYVLQVSLFSDDPFVQEGVKVLVRQTAFGDITLLTEVRDITGMSKHGMTITSSRAIYEKKNPKNRFVVDGIAFETGEGPMTVVSTVVLPTMVAGVWCSTIKFSWWPTLSQREFEMTVPDVCFNTDDAP